MTTTTAAADRTMPISISRRSNRTRRRPYSLVLEAVRMFAAAFFLLAVTVMPGAGSISSSSNDGGDQENNINVDDYSTISSSATDFHCSRVMPSSSSSSDDDDDDDSSTSAKNTVVLCTFPLDAEQIQQAVTAAAQSATPPKEDDELDQKPIMTTTFTQCLSKSSLLLLRSGDNDDYFGDNIDEEEDEEYCIQADIKVMSKRQLLEQQQSSTTGSSFAEADDDEFDIFDNDLTTFMEEIIYDDSVYEEEDNMNGDDTSVVETGYETAAEGSSSSSTLDDTSSTSSTTTTTTSTNDDTSTITVGTTVYTLPYNQYGAHVAQVLRRHRASLTDDDWDDDHDDDNSKTDDDDVLLVQKGRSLLKRARWYQKLGLAHHVQLSEGYKTLKLLRQQDEHAKHANGNDKKSASQALQEAMAKQYMQDQVNFSIQAFQAVVQLNQQASLLQSSSSSSSRNENIGDDDSDNVIHDSLVDGSSPLAIVYYHIAETFALSPNPDQVALARDYLIQSEQLFRRILHNQNEATFSSSTAYRNKGHDMDIVDLQLSWAQVCLRLGVTLLNQSNGLLEYTDTMTTTTSSDASTNTHHHQQQQPPLSKTLKSDNILAAAAAAAAEGQPIPLPRKFLEMLDRTTALFVQAEQILRRAVEQETARRNAATSKNANDAASIIKRQQYQKENRRLASRDADLPFDAMDRIHPEKHFATALHNLASTALYKSDYAKSTMYLEEAWQVYQTALGVLEKPHEYTDYLPQTLAWTNDAVVVEVQLAMGEILYSLADVYLQQGKMRKAKNRYSKAMDWFDFHKIAPPATLTATLTGGGGVGVGGDGGDQSPLLSFILEDADGKMMGGDDAAAAGAAADMLQGGLAAAVAEHERALEEYHELFADGLNEAAANAYMDENIQVGEEYYYARNDGYEGDLHTNLGTMYMAMGDDVQARSHFTQAMQLYRKSGEQGDRTMGDVKYNMAILEFRLGGYGESSQLYEEALDIFLQLYGEGVNPMLMGQQQTTTSSSTTGTKTSTTTSKYQDESKEKPIETVVATPKSTVKNGDDNKHKIHVDIATFQKQGMHLNETTGSDEL